MQPDVFNPSDKYLFYTRSGDFCQGISHIRWSLLCALGEALFLNRTFVLDMDLCVWEGHTGMPSVTRNFSLYFDVQKIAESMKIIRLPTFLAAIGERRRDHPNSPISFKFVDKFYPSEKLLSDNATVVQRELGKEMSPHFAYHVCEHNKVIQRPYGVLWHYSPPLMSVFYGILDELKWDFDAVHVRRGDKAQNATRWPNLDRDTRPERLLQTLPALVQPGRRLYIATDEKSPAFFDPLNRLYPVFLLEGFSRLWAPHSSKWWQLSREVVGAGEEPVFDDYMKAMIDYKLLEFAKKRVETFNDLTADPRGGVI